MLASVSGSDGVLLKQAHSRDCRPSHFVLRKPGGLRRLARTAVASAGVVP